MLFRARQNSLGKVTYILLPNIFGERWVAIIQLGLSHAVGISKVKIIAAMSEVYDIAITPDHLSGPITLEPARQRKWQKCHFLTQIIYSSIKKDKKSSAMDNFLQALDKPIGEFYKQIKK